MVATVLNLLVIIYHIVAFPSLKVSCAFRVPKRVGHRVPFLNTYGVDSGMDMGFTANFKVFLKVSYCIKIKVYLRVMFYVHPFVWCALFFFFLFI